MKVLSLFSGIGAFEKALEKLEIPYELVGFSDYDFERAMKVPTSNTQLYKQAGNSIVVNVLTKIYENLFKEE